MESWPLLCYTLDEIKKQADNLFVATSVLTVPKCLNKGNCDRHYPICYLLHSKVPVTDVKFIHSLFAIFFLCIIIFTCTPCNSKSTYIHT